MNGLIGRGLLLLSRNCHVDRTPVSYVLLDQRRVTDTGRVCFGSCSVFGFLLVLLYQLQLAAAYH